MVNVGKYSIHVCYGQYNGQQYLVIFNPIHIYPYPSNGCFPFLSICYCLIVGLGPGGLGFESGVPPSNNLFHEGILGIQTTNYATWKGSMARPSHVLVYHGPLQTNPQFWELVGAIYFYCGVNSSWFQEGFINMDDWNILEPKSTGVDIQLPNHRAPYHQLTISWLKFLQRNSHLRFLSRGFFDHQASAVYNVAKLAAMYDVPILADGSLDDAVEEMNELEWNDMKWNDMNWNIMKWNEHEWNYPPWSFHRVPQKTDRAPKPKRKLHLPTNHWFFSG